MAFDISRLTSVVNRHLNSISDISARVRQASEEASARAQFAVDLKEAINKNIESKMNLEGAFPDFGSEIQAAAQKATEGISGSIVNGMDSATGNAVSNSDAYSGRLSTEALQELSKSQYFSTNLIQDSLYKTDDDDNEGSSTVTSTNAFGSQPSLSDLNENSLLAAALLTNGSSNLLSDALSSLTTGTNTGSANTLQADSSGQSAASTDNDYVKTLMKAYSNLNHSSTSGSVFGDFLL
jgi:hypothetical protein